MAYVYDTGMGEDVLRFWSKWTSGSGLNQLFNKQWVCLDKNNSISGSLVHLADNDKAPLAGLPVALVRNGEVAHSAIADQAGSFKF